MENNENCNEFEKPTDLLRDIFMKYIYGLDMYNDDPDYDYVEDLKSIAKIANTLDWIDSIIEENEDMKKKVDKLEKNLETWKKYWREATNERDELRSKLNKIKETMKES